MKAELFTGLSKGRMWRVKMNHDLTTFLRDFLPENACKRQRIVVEEGMMGTSEHIPWTPKERWEEPPF